MKIIKGFKCLDKDMKAVNGDGMQYELNKEYSIDDEITITNKGYHFCDNIKDAMIQYYDVPNFRVFECEANERILNKENLYCSSNIKLIRELSKEEIIQYIEYNNLIKGQLKIRMAILNYGYGLDKLINDEYYDIRMAVAQQGYGLNILVNDKDCDVRKVVALQGYRLDILINDEDYNVRRIVALQGYRLDVLINDESEWVREAVAKQGYGLDKLINDESWIVRLALE